MEMTGNEKIALNVTEAASALGVSRTVLYQLIHRPDFPSFKVGSRTIIPRKDLEEWASKQIGYKL